MEKVLVPQINANEDTYILKEYYFSEKQAVRAGDILAAVDSLKAVADIAAGSDGYLHIMKEAEDEVKVGETLALIFDTEDEYEKYMKKGAKVKKDGDHSPKYTLTKSAEKFAEANGLTREDLAGLHKKVIKAADLKQLLKERERLDMKKGRDTGTEEKEPAGMKEGQDAGIKEEEPAGTRYRALSNNQRAVAAAVAESCRTIPRAFLLAKTDCSKAHARMMELTKEFGCVIGFGEVFTVILSELFGDFPMLFSRFAEDGRAELAQNPNIGITYDVGSGLFIPVVKISRPVSLEEVADILLEYKMKALHGDFSAEDLSGGVISVSLNTGDDIVAVVPIILPGQAAMLSVGAVMKEPAFDTEGGGGVVEKEYVYLGVAYDHRLINGFQAMEFAGAVKRKLESFGLKVYNA